MVEAYLQKCLPGDFLSFSYEDGENGCEIERLFKFTAIRETRVVLPMKVADMLRHPDFVVTVIPMRAPPYIQ